MTNTKDKISQSPEGQKITMKKYHRDQKNELSKTFFVLKNFNKINYPGEKSIKFFCVALTHVDKKFVENRQIENSAHKYFKRLQNCVLKVCSDFPDHIIYAIMATPNCH